MAAAERDTVQLKVSFDIPGYDDSRYIGSSEYLFVIEETVKEALTTFGIEDWDFRLNVRRSDAKNF